jgi:6-pyruvoyl-tetrahydropterin synthase
MIEVARRYFFHATHYIEGAPHPWCEPHEHDYTVEVVAAGEPDSLGFVIDTDELDAKWRQLEPRFNHRDLTDTLPFLTSVENIASFLLSEFPDARRVTVWEDDSRWGRATR